MRITQGMVADTSLRNIEQNMQRIEELQSQLTSGSRIRRPSDDPIGTSRALNFQDGLDQAKQYVRNIDEATSWLHSTDSALGSVGTLLHRARELAVQASNGTLGTSDKQALGQEISQIQQQMVQLSNTRLGNAYIFAGTSTLTPPYANPTAGTYAGNTNQTPREIAPSVSVGVNLPGGAIFDPVFQALSTLQTGLSGGGPVAPAISQVDAALDGVLAARADVGARQNRMDAARDRMQSLQVNLADLLSKTKDTDMAAAITNFSMAQSVYQASLKAGAQALQPSLLDYLH